MKDWQQVFIDLLALGNETGAGLVANRYLGLAVLLLPVLIGLAGGRLVSLALTALLTFAAAWVLNTRMISPAPDLAAILWLIALVSSLATLGSHGGTKRIKALEQQLRQVRLAQGELQSAYERELLNRLRSGRSESVAAVPPQPQPNYT